jgi:hypothetical protein
MTDPRGKGFQTPAIENPPYKPCTDFTVPEKDPDRLRSKLPQNKGAHPASSQKVRKFPSQK